jgi:hypothetical protein
LSAKNLFSTLALNDNTIKIYLTFLITKHRRFYYSLLRFSNIKLYRIYNKLYLFLSLRVMQKQFYGLKLKKKKSRVWTYKRQIKPALNTTLEARKNNLKLNNLKLKSV